MNRRQIVESVNAALKGSYADLSRGFFRVFGRTKISVLLDFTVAAYNLDRIRDFRAKMAEEETKPRTRAKRRLGAWPHPAISETPHTTDDPKGPSG